MINSELMRQVKTAIKDNRAFLQKEGPNLKALAAQQAAAKQAEATGGANNNSASSPTASPVAAQIAQLEGLLQMVQPGPQKEQLTQQIAFLKQALGATSPAAGTSTAGAQQAINPFAALQGQQQGAANPIATLISSMMSQSGGAQNGNLFANLFAGMGAQPVAPSNSNPFGYQSSGYGAAYGGGNNNAAMQQMMQLFQGMFAQQQQPPYR